MILTLLIFSVLSVALAFLDAHQILKGKWIKHGVNAGIYLGMLVVPFILFHNWVFIAALLFNRLIFFNMPLSLFRGLPAFYMPLNPLSIIDKLAQKVFGQNGKLMYGTYAVVFTLLLIFSYML